MPHKKTPPVLYIITKLELGGAQKVCLSLFNGIQKQGRTAWLMSGTSGVLVESVKDHPHALLLPSLEREVGISELKAFWHMFKAIKKLRRNYPDLIVHTHSTKAGYMGRVAAWVAGVRTIVHTVHGFGFNDHQSFALYHIALILERLCNLITTRYVCVSSADREEGKQKLRNFSAKTTLIRAAIDDGLFTPATKTSTNDDDDTCVFGTVACFKPQKNLFDLLEAFKTVHQTYTKTRLNIIGDGAQRPLIETWIAEQKLTDVITLHGWQDDPAPIMRTWNCFVLSSLWEGLPCALVEARYLKLPVISYNVGGIAEVIEHGKNGYLCPVKNKTLLARYMLDMAQNKKERLALGAHNDNLQAFSTAAMIKNHQKLYQNRS